MLIIETGAGVTDADTFIDVAEFDDITIRLFGGPMMGDKAPALRRAWAHMATLAWKGVWPAFGGKIPEPVKDAQAVFARAEIWEAGALSVPREEPLPVVEIALSMLARHLK